MTSLNEGMRVKARLESDAKHYYMSHGCHGLTTVSRAGFFLPDPTVAHSDLTWPDQSIFRPTQQWCPVVSTRPTLGMTPHSSGFLVNHI